MGAGSDGAEHIASRFEQLTESNSLRCEAVTFNLKTDSKKPMIDPDIKKEFNRRTSNNSKHF